jgi:serine/threonine protein kinase
MEKCEGTLNDYLRSFNRCGKEVEPFELTEVMIQLLEGLYHCHVQGFTHRDLKPTNGMTHAALSLSMAKTSSFIR